MTQFIVANPASMRNGASHRNHCASCNPKGTPSAEAAEKAVITMPMPAARRSGGTTSPIMDMIIAMESPPKVPLMARATSNVVALKERPQVSVPMINPPYAKRSNFRRSKRSTKGAASKPTMPELTVYAATSALSVFGPMLSSRMSCGPKGIRIMKSTICVNCTAANSNNNDLSESRLIKSGNNTSVPRPVQRRTAPTKGPGLPLVRNHPHGNRLAEFYRHHEGCETERVQRDE